mmetsp:Transcript_10469/g.48008  ORF Transcript_10469/g.48008 Transcript_10469/m.48008 type:complete len:269 (+) Transcript_10469:3105-3911(+)
MPASLIAGENVAGMALSHSLVSIRFVPGVVGAGLCGSPGSSASTRSAATTASIAAADAMSSCVLSPFSNTRRLCTEATDGDADSDAREIWSTRSKNTRCSASLTLCAASSLSLAASRATLSARLRKAFLRSSAFLTAVPGPPQSLSELYGPSNVSVESSSSSSSSSSDNASFPFTARVAMSLASLSASVFCFAAMFFALLRENVMTPALPPLTTRPAFAGAAEKNGSWRMLLLSSRGASAALGALMASAGARDVARSAISVSIQASRS